MHPARTVFADDNVISTLTLIYPVSLRLNSWGITQPILSLPKQQGGYALPAPKEFLHWQFSTLLARLLMQFFTLVSSKIEVFETCFYDIVITQNDHPRYVKHVLGRIYVYFIPFGY